MKKVNQMKNPKKIDPYDVVLDPEEQDIEDALDFDRPERVKNIRARMAQLEAASTNHLRKNRQINIRISEFDLMGLKEVAAREGLPYQTLISSLLHKFISGQTIHR